MPKSDRPNFIVFMTDQQRADYLGCTGHSALKTPNIDAIAEAGTIWDKFYVTSPVCMPNRSSFMTCRLPSSHGVRSNGIPLDKRNITFVDLLKDAGYKTALIGKSHLQNFSGSPSKLERPKTRAGFHRATGQLSEAVRHDHASYTVEAPDQERFNVPLPYHGFDHVELVTRHGDGSQGHYREWLLQKEPNASNLLGPTNQLSHDYSCPQAVRTALPENLSTAAYIAERASAFLESQSECEQPFFLMVSFPGPHHPFNPAGRYWDMYRPDDMQTPRGFELNDWIPPPHVAGVISEREAGRANLKKGGAPVGINEQEAREAQALTCGLISMIDDAIGDIRAAPGADTAVTIFTSDHGDHLGDHRLLFKGDAAYEEVIRVPFIWSDPEGSSTPNSQQIAQTHDIGVSILERARIEPAIGMQGRSIHSEERELAFIQYDHQSISPGLGRSPRVHTLRTDRWRLSMFQGVDWGELYDLDSDPGEFSNLWDDPKYAEDRAKLVELLAREEINSIDHAPFPLGHA